jgi:THO complex subunit 2
VCRERLDLVLLAGVGLIADRSAFEKKEIRTRTGLLYVNYACLQRSYFLTHACSYKQNKFNLLREQSEGYSKLTAELTSSLGPAHCIATGRPTESYTAIEDRARPVWEKVISLIGYFDLDPNRALDIILDVLSVHLTTHYCFFIALLSFSPWAAFYSRPKDDTTMSVDSDPPVGEYKGKSLDEILAIAESKANKGREAMPASSNRNPHVLAQVLGFKFAYYQVGMLAPTRLPQTILMPHSDSRSQRTNAEKPLFDGRYPDPRRFRYT